MSVFLSVILNVFCFGLTYVMMPEISAIEFLALVILVPIIYNVALYIKAKPIVNKSVTVVVLTAITTLSYVVFGFLTAASGVMRDFAVRNSFSDGNVTVSISENSNSMSNIMFIVLAQLCAMVFVKFMQEKGEKNDTGK